MDDPPAILPEYSTNQKLELERIAYLLDELRALRDRGLVSEEAVATVEGEKAARHEEIERLGLAVGVLKAAKAMAGSSTRLDEALVLSERARGLAPENIATWTLSADLLGRLGDYDRAIAVCREGIASHGHEGLKSRASALESERSGRDRTHALARAMSTAREAAARGDFSQALTASRQALGFVPHDSVTRAIEIRSLVALGRLDEAEAEIAALRRNRPAEAAEWTLKVRSLRRDQTARMEPNPEGTPEVAWIGEYDLVSGATAPVSVATPIRPAPAPGPSWAAISGQFLEEHWQKLILALAVLLIVVSSTVGAAMVLGDRLWMAEGKCLLATAYTVLFAGFGRGLTRWGAERAGRIMRLTTLIVLPVSFALVGELPGLGRSSALSLAVLLIDSAAMMALVVVVCRSLGISGGRTVPASLIALGMLDALTPRSASLAWGLSAMFAASCLFAIAGEWLAAWIGTRGPDKAADDDSPYFAFGLLSFYFACTVGRIGGYVLGVPPTLYALPAMLAAATAVRVADGLTVAGHPGRAAALLRLAGFGLSAGAFALGLSRPPSRLPLYSGSTFAAALIGLGLYGRSLWRGRRPVFLYAGFAALFLAYFGMHEFIQDVFSPVEGRIGRFLGYSGRLPIPFRGVNGLVFNAFLAGLAVIFRRRWKDDHLAYHCHAIGLPVSMAACVLSSFEPLAAVVTLAGYAIAYGFAAWLFAAPMLEYLACAAFAGSAIAGSTFLGDLAAGEKSLAMAMVGLIFWTACRLVPAGKVPSAYRDPIVRSARVVAALALIFAIRAALSWEVLSWTTAGAFAELTLLYVLIGLETPRKITSYAATSCAAVAAMFAIRLASSKAGWPSSHAAFSLIPAALSVLYQGIGPWLRLVAGRKELAPERPSRAGAYPVPLFHLGLVLAIQAAMLAVTPLVAPYPDTTDLPWISGTMALILIGLLMASAWTLADETLAFFAVLSGSFTAVAAALTLAWGRATPPPLSGVALALGGLGLALSCLGDRLRSRDSGWLATFRRPTLAVALLGVGLAWLCGGSSWQDSRNPTATLGLTTLAMAMVTRQAPTRPFPDLALACGLATWLVGRGVLSAWNLADLPRDGMLILVYLLALLASAEGVRWLWRRADVGEVRHAFAAALPEFAAVSTLASLAMGGAALWTGDIASLTFVLGLASIVGLWLLRFRPEIGLAHAALVLAWLATGSGTRWWIGDRELGVLLGWLALASAIDALGLGILHLAARSRGFVQSSFVPFRDLAIAFSVASFAMAVAAATQTLDSSPPALVALLLLIPAMLLSAALERSPWCVHGAIVSGVAAAYLTLFVMGRGQQGHVSALGVLATLLSIACWGLERLASRSARGEWKKIFAIPPRDAAFALAVLAVPPVWGAPRVLLLAGVPFLLLIRSVPAAEWLYPSIALAGAAGTFSILGRWGESALVPSAIAAAFACWGLGLALGWVASRRSNRLGQPGEIRYDLPLFHAAIALGAASIGLRLDGISRQGVPWAASPWLPAAWGVLSLLMLKPYPARVWVDGFIGLMSLAMLAFVAPGTSAPMAWVVVALALSLLWRMAEWGASRTQERVCRGLGIGYDRLAGPFREWSFGLLALGTFPMALRIGASVLDAALDVQNSLPSLDPMEWWAGLVAILLFGANVDLARRTIGAAWPPIGAHATATLMIWWAALPVSPLVVGLNLAPTSVLPVASALHGLVSAGLGVRAGSRTIALYGFILSLEGVALTGGRVDSATTASLFLATAASALIVLTGRHRPASLFGSATWGAAVLYASLQAARGFGWGGYSPVATCVAVGQVAVALGLILLGGWDRRRQIGLAEVFERFAVGAMGIAALSVGLASLGHVAPAQSLVNLGVMFALASFCVVLATRRDSMPMAFAAQAAILLGYGAFRAGFAASPAADSAAMLILAAIELGVAEVAGRGRRLFALPALATGLALPLISVALSIRNGPIGDVPLFTMFASGTFYAATCGRMRWRPLGYAAAVLYNAALWVLWSRLGWKMADEPQFFFVPVGFSTILFAEANRRELGRDRVNTIRGVGLALIYLVLAVPIWQTASLGAWAAMLVISLLGIFAGIGLRSQAFLWLGIAGFVLDVVYQLGRIGREHALAKWAIMLALGISLVLFVALNEKKRLLQTMRKYFDAVRQWE